MPIRQHAKSTTDRKVPIPVLSPSQSKAARPPWKNMWKGPLPPRRITPTPTIGDFIMPRLKPGVPGVRPRGHAFDRGRGGLPNRRAGSTVGSAPTWLSPNGLGPVSGAISTRQANSTIHSNTTEPLPPCRPSTQSTAPTKPTHRLINTAAFLAPVLSYREALMAGNQSHGRTNFGRGAQDRRRGRGHGPPPEAHGRGHADHVQERGTRGGGGGAPCGGRSQSSPSLRSCGIRGPGTQHCCWPRAWGCRDRLSHSRG